MTASGLDPMLRPRSVAVVGASADLSRYPGMVTNNLRKFGYPGRVYGVTPRHREVLGHQCFPDMLALPEPVDVALILVGARLVPEVLAQVAASGCRSAIVFSSGMAEIGAQGAAAQAEIGAIAAASGIRLLGPNCLGCLNANASIVLSGAAALQIDKLLPGNLGIVAQSGGMMGSLVDRAWAEGIGVSFAISTGNEVDVDLADCIDFLVDDPDTRAIALFIEAVRDVGHFRAACERAAEAGKPVVALKIGRSERARRVALTHTAALAGDDQAYDALFRRLGVIRVDDVDDLFLTAHFLARARPSQGRRIAIACNSGGLASLAADLCSEYGLPLADLQPATLERIRELQKGFGGADNPLDITGQVGSQENWWMVRHIYELLLADPGVDMLVIGQPTSQYSLASAENIIAVSEQSAKPVVPFWTGRQAIGAALGRLRTAGVPVFEQPAACLRAVRAGFQTMAFHQARDKAGSAPALHIDPARRDAALGILDSAAAGLSEFAAKRLLALYGIESPTEAVVTDAAGAVEAAGRIGYPVAVKAHGAALRHKTEHDAVRLHLAGASGVRDAFAHVTQAADTPEALVAAMAPPGVELILGLARDSQIGLVLIVGMGGVLVEIAPDIATALPPLWPGEASAMLEGLRAAALLRGVRGRPACDWNRLLAAIEALSQLAVEIGDAIEQLDINPLIAGPGGAMAVDALVIPRRGSQHVQEVA